MCCRRKRAQIASSSSATKDSRTPKCAAASDATHAQVEVFVNQFTFVTIQFALLFVQFAGIPLLLLFAVIDEFLSHRGVAC
jgi:hypothetical protein